MKGRRLIIISLFFSFSAFCQNERNISMVFTMAEELSIDEERLEALKSDFDVFESAGPKPGFFRKKRNKSILEIDRQIRQLEYYLEVYSTLKNVDTLEFKEKPMIYSDVFLNFQLELSESTMDLKLIGSIQTLQDLLEAFPDFKKLSNESIYRFQHLSCQLEEISVENVNFVIGQLKILEKRMSLVEEILQSKMEIRTLIFDLSFNIDQFSEKFL
ncbi:hypothetical protein [Algoriphagus namhaensis]